MAANQGSTNTMSQANPAKGRSDQIQRPERSAIDSVSAVSATNIKISGPLSSTPTPSAVHNIVGNCQPTIVSGSRRRPR